MFDLIRSVAKFSVAMPLMAVKQVTSLLSAPDKGDSTAGRIDAVTDALEGQMSGAAKKVYAKGDDLPGTLLGRPAKPRASSAKEAAPEAEAAGGPAAVDSGDLDTSSIVVLGEGLAAGFGDFTLAEESQQHSFPSLLANQMA